MAQGTVCSAQYTCTAVMASGDSSGWGSERAAGATAAVTPTAQGCGKGGSGKDWGGLIRSD